MSHLASLIAERNPAWGALPPEFETAWQWMESKGFGTSTDAGYFLTPYPGEQQLGVVFTDDLGLDSWFDKPAPADLLPFVLVGGDGSMGALWRQSEGEPKVVLLTSDGETCVLTQTPLDFLRLVAVGYDEIDTYTCGDEPDDEESVEAHAEFREWLQETFGVEVPAAWPELGRTDEFTAYVEQVMSDETGDSGA